MPAHYQGNRFFISDFDEELEDRILIPLTEEVARQSDKANGRLDLYINSPGGYLHVVKHMLELVESAKANGVQVRTIVPYMAFSAASMLAVAGTEGERYVGRDAEHLIHYGQIMSFETTPQQIERFSKWKNRQFDRNYQHYKKYCNIPELDKHILDDGYFVLAKDAIKFGMADKYMEKLKI